MEQGTVRRVADRRPIFHSRAAFAVLLLIIFACLVCSPFDRAAQAVGERDRMLEESGIRYPDGFDAQTVGDVQGSVHSLYRPTKGPVSFDLRTQFENYRVIASPPWYWDDLKVQLAEGDRVRVVGSKTLGNDGNLYIVAQVIHLTSGRSVQFREEDGTALWKGGSRGAGGGAGWGSSSRGRGGIGGGYGGGAGRGRR